MLEHKTTTDELLYSQPSSESLIECTNFTRSLIPRFSTNPVKVGVSGPFDPTISRGNEVTPRLISSRYPRRRRSRFLFFLCCATDRRKGEPANSVAIAGGILTSSDIRT